MFPTTILIFLLTRRGYILNAEGKVQETKLKILGNKSEKEAPRPISGVSDSKSSNKI